MLESQKEIVKATLPALRENGEVITRVFYEDLENGAQAKRLATAILAYVGNIDHLDLLGPAVTNIRRRHVTTHVKPAHYPIVGHHLLKAIKTVLDEAATPEIVDAWAAAYTDLAGIMIATEETIYAKESL
jgi:nitric oxide dioxygenase